MEAFKNEAFWLHKRMSGKVFSLPLDVNENKWALFLCPHRHDEDQLPDKAVVWEAEPREHLNLKWRHEASWSTIPRAHFPSPLFSHLSPNMFIVLEPAGYMKLKATFGPPSDICTLLLLFKALSLPSSYSFTLTNPHPPHTTIFISGIDPGMLSPNLCLRSGDFVSPNQNLRQVSIQIIAPPEPSSMGFTSTFFCFKS